MSSLAVCQQFLQLNEMRTFPLLPSSRVWTHIKSWFCLDGDLTGAGVSSVTLRVDGSDPADFYSRSMKLLTTESLQVVS